ncbi:MAG TPA: hypothetical protein PLF40_18715 [Kofleriaceae bacterium]|nr:hypothetical protein [Kofleriaceae bacterium]
MNYAAEFKRKWAGVWITFEHNHEHGISSRVLYVPSTASAHLLKEANENFEYDDEIEEGWRIVAVGGVIPYKDVKHGQPAPDGIDDDDDDDDDDDAFIQVDSMMAIHRETGEVEVLDEGAPYLIGHINNLKIVGYRNMST